MKDLLNMELFQCLCYLRKSWSPFLLISVYQIAYAWSNGTLGVGTHSTWNVCPSSPSLEEQGHFRPALGCSIPLLHSVVFCPSFPPSCLYKRAICYQLWRWSTTNWAWPTISFRYFLQCIHSFLHWPYLESLVYARPCVRLWQFGETVVPWGSSLQGPPH